MPAQRNVSAGLAIREMRVNAGLSRRELCLELTDRYSVRAPSRRTLERIEIHGAEPTERIKFALADFFGCQVTDIWALRAPTQRRLAA